MKKSIIIFSLLSLVTYVYSQDRIITQIDSVLKQYDTNNFPGLSIGVVKSGNIVYNKGFGLANLEFGIKNSDTSVFDIASIAKQFTAACIWSLVEEGKISLDDDVRKYLPELPFYGDTMRIRHMLNHTSGLRHYSSLKELAGEDYSKEFFDNQSVLELMCRQKGLNNKPGEKVLYGNSPYNLLTIVIERIMGISFNEYAIENIFKPLGMENTYYRTNNTSIVKNRAVGYIGDKKSGFRQFPRIESCYGAGSLWSTVEDLIIWTNLFAKPTKDHASMVEFLITKDTLTSGQLSSYSRGVMVDVYKNHKTVHHGGMTKGYRSQIITLPEIELSIIILANFQNIEPSQLSYKIIDLFIPDIKTNSNLVANYSHKMDELKEFEGDYQELNSSLKMKILLDSDTLKAKSSLGNDFVNLVSKYKNSMYRQGNESVKYVFRNEDSPFDLIIYFGATPFYFERISLIDPKQFTNKDYAGEFYSKELETTYKIFVANGQLYLSYPNNPKVKLVPGQKDEFGNGYRTKYSFFRDENGCINGMNVASEGTVKNIEFIKKPGSHVL